MGGMVKLMMGPVLALVVAAALGCGSDSSGTAATTAVSRPYPWLKGPSREFLIRDGDNAVQTFGREASKAEREEASRLISAWMKARAAQDWKKDCSYFSKSYVHSLVDQDARRVTHGKVKTCPEALAFFRHLASGTYKNNLTGPIDSLRVSEGQGFAQYHGNDGHDWVVPLTKENGRWRIAKATPLGRNS
jgi:hypothetical protein